MSFLLERLGVEPRWCRPGWEAGCHATSSRQPVSEAGGLGTIGTLPARALARGSPPLAPDPMTDRRQPDPTAGRQAPLGGCRRGRRDRDALGPPAAPDAGRLDPPMRFGGGSTRPHRRRRRSSPRASRPAAPARCCLHVNCSNAFRPGSGGIPGPDRGRPGQRRGRARRLGLGCSHAVILGTRFLMTAESRAHASYKARLVEAGDPAHRPVRFRLAGTHRVLPNAATPLAGRRSALPVGHPALDWISWPPGRLPLPAEPPAREWVFRS